VIYDYGQVSLEHRLLSRHPSHAPVDVMNENFVEPTNPESIKTVKVVASSPGRGPATSERDQTVRDVDQTGCVQHPS